jgi:hypothetical protein
MNSIHLGSLIRLIQLMGNCENLLGATTFGTTTVVACTININDDYK